MNKARNSRNKTRAVRLAVLNAATFAAEKLLDTKKRSLSLLMFLAIPVAALCFGGYVAAANAVSSQIEKDVVRLTAELDAQKQKNENNRLFLEELRKPGSPGFRAYAERIAYRDLGLSYPGDTIFVDPTATSP